MKKLLIILTILLLPLSVWAMTPVSDTDLSEVTGQAGLNINADLMMDIQISTLAWGDASGLDWGFGWDTNVNDALGTGNDAAGYFGVTGFNLNSIHIRARTEINDTYGGYSLTSHALGANHLKPITIDVATGTAALPEHGNGVTFVRLGLGSLQVGLQEMDFLLSLGPAGSNLNQNLFEIYIGDLNIYINANSYVDIYKNPVTNSGVTFDVNVTLDKVYLTALSFGDTDGATNTSGYTWMTSAGAGYIGLQNWTMGAVTLVGSVSIDVNTATSGEYLAAEQYLFDTYLAPGLGTSGVLTRPTSVSVVHITFGENGDAFSFLPLPLFAPPVFFLICSKGEFTANVNLSPYKNLTSNTALGQPLGNTKTLGDIYISDFGISIQSGSWLDIWGH